MSLCITVVTQSVHGGKFVVEHVSIIFDLDSTIIASVHPDVDDVWTGYRLDRWPHLLSTPVVSELCSYSSGSGSSEVIARANCLWRLLGGGAIIFTKCDVRSLGAVTDVCAGNPRKWRKKTCISLRLNGANEWRRGRGMMNGLIHTQIHSALMGV